MRPFRLALAQINPMVGDLDGNTRKIVEYIDRAHSIQADLVAFPELALTGYPPEDLLLRSQFVEENICKMKSIAANSPEIAIILGFVNVDPQRRNAAAIAHGGKLMDVYHKIHLPNYGVFDEERYFKAGTQCPVYSIADTAIGINICEDIWETAGPTASQQSQGARIIINISGSPFYAGRLKERKEMLARRAREYGIFIGYVNLVGGQDELVFDGASMVLDPHGNILAQGVQFEEELITVDLDIGTAHETPLYENAPHILKKISTNNHIYVSSQSGNPRPLLPDRSPIICDPLKEIYSALVLGTREYVGKTGFNKVLVALSGGIDSALVTVIAVDALGPDNVTAVAMPSRYSSEGSLIDARSLTANLGIDLWTLPIEESFSVSLNLLTPHRTNESLGLTEENLQSRLRGDLIMALSNEYGWMVLTTGNKSEIAVGYTTIYGDMAGGYAVIKDVPKTLVYSLSKYRNSTSSPPPIPETIIKKAPSAELRPNQKDEDSLPPYTILDPILKAYVEDDMSFDEIVSEGFDQEIVTKVIRLVDQSEYKRRQAPPGIKITPRNFGRDRRMPIANLYRPFKCGW